MREPELLPTEFGRGQFLRTGCVLPENLPFDEWRSMWSRLRTVEGAIQWIQGDWLNFGAEHYKFTEFDLLRGAANNGNGHASKYASLLTFSEDEYQTLRNRAWVARSIPLSRRRDKLNWSHHAEIARLPAPQQTRWLDHAEEHDWSVAELRRQLRQSSAERIEPILRSGFVLGAWIDEGLRGLRTLRPTDWPPTQHRHAIDQLKRLHSELAAFLFQQLGEPHTPQK